MVAPIGTPPDERNVCGVLEPQAVVIAFATALGKAGCASPPIPPPHGEMSLPARDLVRKSAGLQLGGNIYLHAGLRAAL